MITVGRAAMAQPVGAVRPPRGDLRRLLTNAPLMIGGVGLLMLVFLALFGPYVAPADPHAQRNVIFYPDGTFSTPPTPPDRYYPLGTDPIGRDQLSRLLWGARLTLTIVVLGLAGRALLGIGLGLLSGWRRGTWVDHLVALLTRTVGGLPQLMLALLLVIVLRDHGLTGFVLALALAGWSELARFVRVEVISAATSQHVEAARALGATSAHVLRAHIVRDLTPQLLGLLALEAGSILLLLAELGFIGFFIAGGVFYTSDGGAPVLPIRDRAPEWGQMLAGARHYTFAHQYVAFVPGVVVVGTVLAFNFFAEGLRKACDPHSASRLAPRTLEAIGRTLAAGALIAVLTLTYISVRTTNLSFAEGLDAARQTASATLPGSTLVGAVVRLSSGAHGISRPERLTYYFRAADGPLLRISFKDANANAIDVKLYFNEDNLPIDGLQNLDTAGLADWETALRVAEGRGGSSFRNRGAGYVVQVVLTHPIRQDRAEYAVRYSRGVGVQIEVRVDAVTGQPLGQ